MNNWKYQSFQNFCMFRYLFFDKQDIVSNLRTMWQNYFWEFICYIFAQLQHSTIFSPSWRINHIVLILIFLVVHNHVSYFQKLSHSFYIWLRLFGNSSILSSTLAQSTHGIMIVIVSFHFTIYTWNTSFLQLQHPFYRWRK